MIQQPDDGVTIDAVMALLRDGVTRRFRIDIEADSTVIGDESQEKQDRTEFLKMMTEYVTGWAPLIAQAPALAKLAGDGLLFGVRGFRVGRELEETIEEVVDQLEEQASQPKGPDPEMEKAQIGLETEKVKAQSEIQKAQIDHAKTQMDFEHQQAMRAHEITMAQQAQAAKQQEQEAAQAGMAAQQQADQANQTAQSANTDKVLSAMQEAHAAAMERQNKLQEQMMMQTASNAEILKALVGAVSDLKGAMSKPKRIVRDMNGDIIGAE